MCLWKLLQREESETNGRQLNAVSSAADLPKHQKRRWQERRVHANNNRHLCGQPTYLMAGFVLERSVFRDRRGIWGGEMSVPKPYIQKHIPKNVLKKLLSDCPQRTVGVWNVAGFILDLPTLTVLV